MTGPPPQAPPAAAAPNPPAVPAVERIIVAAADGPAPPAPNSFAPWPPPAAKPARWAAKLIELHFNGAREESPLDISSLQLTIRNGVGFHPAIVFRPSFQDLAWDRRMIRVGGGRLEWQGVHVRMELPREPADSWAMFSCGPATTWTCKTPC